MTDPDDPIDGAAKAGFEGWDFSWLANRSDDPMITTTWRHRRIRRRASSCQPGDAIFTEWSAISKGESSFRAWRQADS